MNLQPHNLREFDAKRRRQGNWLLAAILAFLLFAIWAVTASAETVYVKDTGSMRPWIAHGGGFYALQRLPFNQVKPGMVIVWKHPTAGFIAHRVIEVHPGKLWTKGDSNKTPDNDWCYPSEYLGVILSARQP